MFFVLTPAGESALAGSATPPVLTLFRCGSNFGYVPSPLQPDITGTSVASGTPSVAVVQSANLLKYTVYLDTSLGDFTFGEVGLYLPGSILFAIGVNSTPIQKLKDFGVQKGNSFAIDCFISAVDSNYAIFAELGNSSNELNLPALPNVDTLPRAVSAIPNIYQIASPDGNGSVIAFSNNAVWSITGYEEKIDEQYVVSATVTTCQVGTPSFAPAYPGELLAQWTTGKNLGVIRKIAGYVSATQTFVFDSPLMELPDPNDKLIILKKTMLRPNVAELLAGLDPALTSGDLNSLLTNPLNEFIRRDGSVPMVGNFNAGFLRIINTATPVVLGDAANKGYVDAALGTTSAIINDLQTTVNQINSSYLRKDGAIPMSGILNFGGFRATNLSAPIAPADAVNKGYLDTLITTVTDSLISDHSELTGLQGGTAGQYYHLTNAQYTFVANLVSNGYPVAGYGQPGISAFSTAFEVGVGSVNNEGITAESLYLALTNVGPANNLQSAIIQTANQYFTTVQFGSGDPGGATPGSPSFYCDVATTPYRLWVFRSGSWRSLTTQVVQFGSGAPTGLTSVQPPIYLDIITFPFTQYTYFSGNWVKSGGPYSQFGTGEPTVATPTEPSIYFDVSQTPRKMYVFQSGVWTQVGDDSVVPNHAKLFFYCQF